jgi:hypothetical protein
MTSTRTMSGRVARVAVVVVAALASLVTGVSAAQASPQPGSTLPTSQGLRADGLRWQGIARIYQLREPAVPRYYGSQAPYASTITRTQPLPRYYGSTAPYTPQGLRADGLRWQGIARVYEQKQTGARAASTGTSNGFDWGDAGIGVAAGIGAMLLAGVAAIGFRRQSRLAAH